MGGVYKVDRSLCPGKQNYRACGPPKLDCAPATLEEELFAKRCNEGEGDMKEFAAVVKFAGLEEILEEESDEEGEEHVSAEEFKRKNSEISGDTCSCSAMAFCCMSLSAMKVEMEAIEVSSAEKLKFLLAQEGGISVEYRCVLVMQEC